MHPNMKFGVAGRLIQRMKHRMIKATAWKDFHEPIAKMTQERAIWQTGSETKLPESLLHDFGAQDMRGTSVATDNWPMSRDQSKWGIDGTFDLIQIWKETFGTSTGCDVE